MSYLDGHDPMEASEAQVEEHLNSQRILDEQLVEMREFFRVRSCYGLQPASRRSARDRDRRIGETSMTTIAVEVDCPQCNGTGELPWQSDPRDPTGQTPMQVQCPCITGKVWEEQEVPE